MYWQESKEETRYAIPDDVVDVAFNISCRCLRVDHAYALSQALRGVLPWFGDNDDAGVHPIHVADSGNGWMRPEKPEDILYLSRRTKLVLRIPKHRIEVVMTLNGKTLDIAGNKIEMGPGMVKRLSTITTLFSRYIVTDETDDETGFLNEMMSYLTNLNIQPKKMLCGMKKTITTPEKQIRTRSLMLADLTVEESVKLQQRGIGPLRYLGCGLLIPHKDVNEVKQKSG